MAKAPEQIKPMEQPTGGRFGKGGAFAALALLIGSGTAAIVVPEMQRWEGRELVAYRDIVGVLTICDGDTKNVRAGQVATDAECDARLQRQLIAHAEPVLACVPALRRPERQQQLAASIVLAYNIGPAGYCRSTAARRFNAGQWRAGCDAFLLWNRAGGKVVRGLTNRRKAEHAICIKGLP